MIYDDEVLADAPLVYYRDEETSGTDLVDTSGNGFDGTYASSGVTYRTYGPQVDRVSYGAAFDGVAGYATRVLTILQRPVPPFVLEAWCRAPSAAAGSVVIQLGGETETADDVYAQIGVSAGPVWSMSMDTGTGEVAKLSTAAPSSGWDHLAARFVGDSERHLYINGALAASDTVTVTLPSQSLNLFLGAFRGASGFLSGALCRAAYYNADVSVARLAAHYRAAVLTGVYHAVSEALKADASLLAATSGRIFADQMPDDQAVPGLRYVLLTDSPHHRLTHGDNFTADLQVDAYAMRGDDNLAWVIADAARSTLKRLNTRAPGYSRVAVMSASRPTPLREGSLSRIRATYRLFGSAA